MNLKELIEDAPNHFRPDDLVQTDARFLKDLIVEFYKYLENQNKFNLDETID